MKKCLLLPILLTLLLTVSCDVFQLEVKPTIRIITVASDYKNLQNGPNNLPLSPVDQKGIKDQLEFLSQYAGYEYEGIHVTYENGMLSATRSSSRNGESEFCPSEYLPYQGNSAKHMNPLILDVLDTVATEAQDNDVTVFYYSGHGAGYRDTLKMKWLKVGTLFFEGNSQDGLHPDELHAAMAKIRGKKLIMIDACYSGAFVYNDINYPDSTEKAFEELFTLPTIKNDNMWIMSASKDTEQAYAPSSKKGGFSYFTQEVLNYLGYDSQAKEPALPTKTDICYSDILSYAQEFITYSQHPQGEDTIRDLCLFSLPNL